MILELSFEPTLCDFEDCITEITYPIFKYLEQQYINYKISKQQQNFKKMWNSSNPENKLETIVNLKIYIQNQSQILN